MRGRAESVLGRGRRLDGCGLGRGRHDRGKLRVDGVERGELLRAGRLRRGGEVGLELGDFVGLGLDLGLDGHDVGLDEIDFRLKIGHGSFLTAHEERNVERQCGEHECEERHATTVNCTDSAPSAAPVDTTRAVHVPASVHETLACTMPVAGLVATPG